MSEQDRMNRADRIRRMREGERTDDEPQDEDPATTDDGSDADDGTGEAGTGEGTPAEASGSADEKRPDAEAQESADGEDDDSSSEAEDVADVVETIADVSAPIPSSGGVDDESTSDPADAPEASSAESAPGQAGPGVAPGTMDAQVDVADDEATPAGLAAGVATTSREDATRVLVFSLEGERYCLDIEYIEEIVKQETITRVPNTPEHVEGVVDMRGQITTILNPKIPIEKEMTDPGEHLLVFDSEAFEEQGHLGWVVDDVRQVRPVTDEEVNESPGQAEYVNGVIEDADDEEFVVWTTPNLALEDAV